ncbi:MAG: SdiA-regulated family protein, partial [Pseudopedobacter saltans]
YADLDVKKYPQPEGMAFDNKGNLWIASEAGNKKYGKLYKIERN